VLREHFDARQDRSGNGQVFVELDLRAFAHPQRMQQIERAAATLVLRILSACPACAAPGFQLTERQPGLPCSACGLPTAGYRREVWRCLRCSHCDVRDRTDRRFAEPAHCSYCNP
jgi:hypothetical protein